jgi:hypothetical protein
LRNKSFSGGLHLVHGEKVPSLSILKYGAISDDSASKSLEVELLNLIQVVRGSNLQEHVQPMGRAKFRYAVQ